MQPFKFILLALILSTVAAGAASRPNILFVIVDDQSPLDLKCYNPSSELDTPNIDKLASQGMVIDGAYHMGSFAGAVCFASRHMIMTGRTVWHLAHSGTDAPPKAPEDLPTYTMPAVFNQAGYDTMRTCKRGNSYEDANKLFTVRHDKTSRGAENAHGSPWHGHMVLKYLEERQKSNDTDPFLIYFGFSHPHDTRDGRPELLKKYGAMNHRNRNALPPANDQAPKLPSNWLPAHPFHDGHPNLRDEVAVHGVWNRRDERTVRNEKGREFACSEAIDVELGHVLDKLREMGELNNTYVVYTSDHGIAVGRHGLMGKQNLYEHTWRVPLIVQGPGIKPGRAQGNVYLLDLLATFCDLSGVPTPKTNEGLSFKPVLDGKKPAVRDVMYGVYSGGTKPGMRCVKKDNWKLIKYDVLGGKVRQTQLFNLDENPDEYLAEHHDPEVRKVSGAKPAANQTNLANNPAYAAKLAEMEALLLEEMKRYDDPYRLWNQPQL